jgi:hypothetical protein
MSWKKWITIIVLVVTVDFFIFIVLTAGTALSVIIGLHGREVHYGKRSEGVIIKRRHWERKLVELVDAQLLILCLWLLKSMYWRWQVSRHQANIPLSTLRTPPEEEEEGGADRGAAELERVDRGGAEVEGTSLVMIGATGNCGFRSMISWSMRNSIPDTFSIIIVICGAYPQLRRAILEMLIISWSIESNTENHFFWT